MKYIKFKNFEEVRKIGEFWIARCVDDKLPNGTLFHHLPLRDEGGNPLDLNNIFLNDTLRQSFKGNMKTLEKYRKEVENADKKCLTLNSGIMDMRQVLPSWIVYPYHPADSIMMTDYHKIFKEFYSRMTPMERPVYERLYPIPEYMKPYFNYKA